MLELVGTCTNCEKEIYCRDGFLDGVYIEGELFCFACADEKSE